MRISVIRRSLPALTDKTEGLVAVMVGGTSGIGEATTLEMCRYLGTGSRIYIVGRNRENAERIIRDCRERSSSRGVDIRVEFLQQDVALLRDVDKVCDEIRRRENKVDILFMTQGYLSWRGWTGTDEGLDHCLSLRYYSRMRFVTDLLPLLERAPAPRALSVWVPGRAEIWGFDPDDPGLARPGRYTPTRGMAHASFLNTLFMAALARRHRAVAFVHVFPGWVATPEWDAAAFPPRFKRFAIRWLLPVFRRFAFSYRECGERMLWNCFAAMYPPREASDEARACMLTAAAERRCCVAVGQTRVLKDLHGVEGGGAYCVSSDGEASWHRRPMKKVLKAGGEEKVWEHTMEVFRGIGKGPA